MQPLYNPSSRSCQADSARTTSKAAEWVASTANSQSSWRSGGAKTPLLVDAVYIDPANALTIARSGISFCPAGGRVGRLYAVMFCHAAFKNHSNQQTQNQFATSLSLTGPAVNETYDPGRMLFPSALFLKAKESSTDPAACNLYPVKAHIFGRRPVWFSTFDALASGAV